MEGYWPHSLGLTKDCWHYHFHSQLSTFDQGTTQLLISWTHCCCASAFPHRANSNTSENYLAVKLGWNSVTFQGCAPWRITRALTVSLSQPTKSVISNWNSLPRVVVELSSPEILKTLLDAFLCSLPSGTCSSREVGVDDLQRSLPTSMTLWFCEILTHLMGRGEQMAGRHK